MKAELNLNSTLILIYWDSDSLQALLSEELLSLGSWEPPLYSLIKISVCVSEVLENAGRDAER